MAYDLDGLAVLRGMAAHPAAFAGIEAEAAKMARTLLVKLLKARSTTLQMMRTMAAALPDGTLSHVTDGMSNAEITALVVRLDRLNPATGAMDRHARAILIGQLISGAAEPAARAAPPATAPAPPRAAKKAAPSAGVAAAAKVLQSKAMGARKAAKAKGA